MIRWPEIAPILQGLLGRLATNPAHAGDIKAEWAEGQRKAISTGQKTALFLKLTNVSSIGRDENRAEFVADDATDVDDIPYRGALRESLVGQRKFTLQIQAHSVDRSDEFMCMVPLDRIRVGLRRRSTLDFLAENNVAIIEIRDAVKANYKDGGRVVSAGSMDVVFCASFEDVDPAPGGVLDAIRYTSHVEDVDGIELPVPPNVTDHLVPSDWTPPS